MEAGGVCRSAYQQSVSWATERAFESANVIWIIQRHLLLIQCHNLVFTMDFSSTRSFR